MNVEPAVIYAAFGAIATSLAVLWNVVLKDHRDCQRSMKLLIEHTIAQQIDIKKLVDDRAQRRFDPVELESEKTAFFRKHIEKQEVDGGEI